MIHDVRNYWRIKVSAVHCRQEQFENAVQEHQRVADEQVGFAAALVTSRAAAQKTSRSATLRVMTR